MNFLTSANYAPALIDGLCNMKDMNYVPANVPGTQFMPDPKSKLGAGYTPSYKEFDRTEKFNYSWWEDSSFFKYPFLLVSAFYGMKYPDFRKYFNIGKDTCLLGDSGGFSAGTQGKDLDPIEVVDWQEKNCDIGFILDIIPYEWNNGVWKVNNELFKKSAIKTGKYGEAMFKRKKKLKLYGIIQGATERQVAVWYKNLTKRIDYDGYSIAPKVFKNQSRMDNIIMSLGQVYRLIDHKKPLHILGIGSPSYLAVVYYFSKFWEGPITFDSSSYSMGARTREYILPNILNSSITTNKDCSIENIFCDCPVCSKCRMENLTCEGSEPGGLISLHNLYMTIRATKMLKELVVDDALFMNIVEKYFPKGTSQAINKLKRNLFDKQNKIEM